MSGNLRQSLFFKREIAEKAPELLGMLGVDLYLDDRDLGQEKAESSEEAEGPEEDSEEEAHWQAVQYQMRQPYKMVPPQLHRRIHQDYELATGTTWEFSQQPAEQEGDGEEGWSAHWQIRQEQALVDRFAVRAGAVGGRRKLQQLLEGRTDERETLLLQCIDGINSRWEFEGIEISSAFLGEKGCRLVVRLNSTAFLYDYSWHQNGLFLQMLLKAAIIDKIAHHRPLSLHLQNVDFVAIRSTFDEPIEAVIWLASELGRLGLTLPISMNQISPRLLTRSNELTYRRCVYFLARSCADNQVFEEEALGVVECKEEHVEAAFERLVARAQSKQEHGGGL